MKLKPNILNMTCDELAGWFEGRGIQAYRAGQVMKWIHSHQVDAFEEMTNLSKAHRALLTEHFDIRRLQIENVAVSSDGSRKYLFRLSDGNLMESVLMPERGHNTLCVSSQVGCAQGCLFCLTGSGGLERNLKLAEIISQIRDIQNEDNQSQPLTNLVFMGMGEPLANYRNLRSALEILTNNQYGYRFANRRITVSTAGLVPKIKALGDDTRVNLAISLNAADDATRDRLMPINRKYPIEKLLEACRDFPLRGGRRITFEYVLLKDVNDSADDADCLAKLLRPIKAKINLIPFNSHPGCPYQRPPEDTILRFQKILIDKSYTVMIRRSKGQDISAACGQLATYGPRP